MSFWSNVLDSIGGVVSNVPIIGEAIGGFMQGTAADIRLDDERDWNAGQAQRNRDFQREERLASQEFNLDMWNLNNEYNDPTEVLKRNMAAGLNPNAILSGNQVGTFAKPVTTSPMSGNVASPASSIANTMLTRDAVVKNLLAQAKKTETEADLNEQTLSWNKIEIPKRISVMEQTWKKLDAETKSLLSDTKVRQDTFQLLANKSQEELNILKEQANEVKAKVELLKQQKKTEEEQTTLVKNQASLEGLKVKFSQDSNVPYGTDIFEAIWKTVVNGDLPIVIDKLMNGVVETVSYALPSGANIVDGYKWYKQNKDTLPQAIKREFKMRFALPNYRNP